MAVYELQFFPTKMQIFESSNKNTISTTTLNYRGPLGLWHQFFLKSIDLKVPNLTAPLNSNSIALLCQLLIAFYIFISTCDFLTTKFVSAEYISLFKQQLNVIVVHHHHHHHNHHNHHYTICGAVCFQFTHFRCDDWENIYTLSYYHHQIETVSADGRSARPARLGGHPTWWRWHGNTKSLSKVQSSDV